MNGNNRSKYAEVVRMEKKKEGQKSNIVGMLTQHLHNKQQR